MQPNIYVLSACFVVSLITVMSWSHKYKFAQTANGLELPDQLPYSSTSPSTDIVTLTSYKT